jgi:hypothetical protein
MTKTNNSFWNNDKEIQFFKEALRNFASPEQLFYTLESGKYAYIPKGNSADGKALQSRNSLIGNFTEKWTKSFFSEIAESLNLYAVNSVVCEELGLSKQTSADLAFCTTEEIVQKAENIKLICEVKMSVVSNYKFINEENIALEGDYHSHKGQPSLLRSDSMLKAIGKSINIRVSGTSSTKIPILVLGNTPITQSYIKKVDFLKKSGVIQGFISLNPNIEGGGLKESPEKGFQTFLNYKDIADFCKDLINTDLNYFSSMLSKSDLGKIITIANQEKTEIAKAEKFLSLIQS